MNLKWSYPFLLLWSDECSIHDFEGGGGGAEASLAYGLIMTWREQSKAITFIFISVRCANNSIRMNSGVSTMALVCKHKLWLVLGNWGFRSLFCAGPIDLLTGRFHLRIPRLACTRLRTANIRRRMNTKMRTVNSEA